MPIEPLSKYRTQNPLVIERKLKRAAIEKDRISVKAEVFKRDSGLCRCCGAHATELHELKTRGAGGKRSRYNSVALCGFTGNSCHRLIHVHVIEWAFTDEAKGADRTIRFTMPATGREWEG